MSTYGNNLFAQYYAQQNSGYIRNGLIAMWDGIDNAGVGVHDNIARAVDLVGFHPDITCFSSMLDDAMKFTSGNSCTFAANQWNDFRSALCSGQFTFESCIELDYHDSWATIIYSSGSNNDSRFNIRPSLDSKSTSYRKIQAFLYSSSAVGGWAIGSNYQQIIPSDLQFTNISFSSNKNNATLYCDSESLSINDGAFPIQMNDYALCFGREYSNGNYNNGAYGKWHCIRWYNRSLTPSEVAHNYRIDKKRFNLP